MTNTHELESQANSVAHLNTSFTSVSIDHTILNTVRVGGNDLCPHVR
jgi:hypothetical protein